MTARDNDADFEAAIMDWRAAQEETDAALDDAVRQEIARIERRIANMTPAQQTRATALALTMRLQTLRRAYPHIGRTA